MVYVLVAQGGSLNTMTAYVLIALEMCADLNETVVSIYT